VRQVTTLIGVFVGGKSTRMGGLPKGLLQAPDRAETLLARALRLCAGALPAAPRVLVGEASAYAGFACPVLADDPAGIGPLGGLHALLLEAQRREVSQIIALSCDLPHFSQELLLRLTAEQPEARALAPRQAERWQPFFARYASFAALEGVEQTLAAGDRSLQRVLQRLEPAELLLSESERDQLRDWDRPEDIQT
jgi:molybdopterin-guanine dinucleotide biosynthesis protein A